MITQWPVLLAVPNGAEGDGWYCDYGPLRDNVSPRRHPVVVLPEDAMDRLRHPKKKAAFEIIFGPVPHTVLTMLAALARFAEAAHNRNLRRMAKLAWDAVAIANRQRPVGERANPYYSASAAVRSPLDTIGAAVNAGIAAGSIRPVLWQRESLRKPPQLVPALLCSDAAKALFVQALFDITGKWGLRICGQCGAYFPASRDKSCCSRRCDLARNQRLYRKRLKRKRDAERQRGHSTPMAAF